MRTRFESWRRSREDGGGGQAYRAIQQLTAAGLVRETRRSRDRAGVAVEVAAELDDLAARIAARVDAGGSSRSGQ